MTKPNDIYTPDFTEQVREQEGWIEASVEEWEAEAKAEWYKLHPETQEAIEKEVKDTGRDWQQCRCHIANELGLREPEYEATYEDGFTVEEEDIAYVGDLGDDLEEVEELLTAKDLYQLFIEAEAEEKDGFFADKTKRLFDRWQGAMRAEDREKWDQDPDSCHGWKTLEEWGVITIKETETGIKYRLTDDGLDQIYGSKTRGKAEGICYPGISPDKLEYDNALVWCIEYLRGPLGKDKWSLQEKFHNGKLRGQKIKPGTCCRTCKYFTREALCTQHGIKTHPGARCRRYELSRGTKDWTEVFNKVLDTLDLHRDKNRAFRLLYCRRTYKKNIPLKLSPISLGRCCENCQCSGVRSGQKVECGRSDKSIRTFGPQKGTERFRGSLVFRFGICSKFKPFAEYEDLKRIATTYKKVGLSLTAADLEASRLSRADAKKYRMKPIKYNQRGLETTLGIRRTHLEQKQAVAYYKYLDALSKCN